MKMAQEDSNKGEKMKRKRKSMEKTLKQGGFIQNHPISFFSEGTFLKTEEKNSCYKCDIEIDEEDTICCSCIDDTDGRNQYFWKITEERE